MLNRLLARLRIPTVIAAILALVVTGAASGVVAQYLILGQQNDSGTSQTVLNNAGLGAAFTLKTTNTATGATGIFGWSNNTGTHATKGVYGLVNGANSYGVYGLNTGPAGSGAAVYADGGNNTGLSVSVASNSIPPIKVNSTGFVANLNADMVDGKHASAFHQYNANAPAFSTQYGAFSVEGTAAGAGQYDDANISYPVPTGSSLTPQVIKIGDSLPTGCSGSVTAPAASAGYLCIFVGYSLNIATSSVSPVAYNPATGYQGTSRYGADVQVASTAAGGYVLSGTWAATAPFVIIILPSPSGPQAGLLK